MGDGAVLDDDLLGDDLGDGAVLDDDLFNDSVGHDVLLDDLNDLLRGLVLDSSLLDDHLNLTITISLCYR